MDRQLHNFLANLSDETSKEIKPVEAHPADEEVREALAICNGDAVAALRITLIANAFLEAQIDELKSQMAGFGHKRNPARTKVEDPTQAKRPARAAKAGSRKA
jgi:hypothetical protein